MIGNVYIPLWQALAAVALVFWVAAGVGTLTNRARRRRRWRG